MKLSKPLILASASPRRRQLLKRLGIPFKVIPSGLAEPPPGFLPATTYARKVALAKANLVAKRLTAAAPALVLGADTVVVHRGQILGKPVDFADACRMLSLLSGTTHQVVTAVALVDASTGRSRVAHAVSRVTLKKLTPREIALYARKHLDKAGAYAAQEKRDPVVKKMEGSYTNVVGLPLELVKKLGTLHLGTPLVGTVLSRG